MTTVGYGDFYPETTVGRMIAMGVMLVGIGFVAILTAALAERFLSQEVRAEAGEVEEEVAEAEAELLDELLAISHRLRSVEQRLTRRE